ncbi:MAG: MBL fold metallo-hydrolase [Lachnospiraceae bacterium]|jgi:ribonuclease Z
MERLIMLGTGSALDTRCYNTCFALQNDEEYMLIDAGGGNGILRQIAAADIDCGRIHNIFLSSPEPSHLLGAIWVIRLIGDRMREETYEGDLRIYGQPAVLEALRVMSGLMLSRKLTWLYDHRILFVSLYDEDDRTIMGRPFHFFDTCSSSAKQYGFSTELADGGRLTFTGDEPLPESCYGYAEGSTWLMHAAYCLHSQKEIYNPYEKGYGTVKEACELAHYLEIPNLILVSTEDDNLERRSDLYKAESRLYYHGNVVVPDDLEIISL